MWKQEVIKLQFKLNVLSSLNLFCDNNIVTTKMFAIVCNFLTDWMNESVTRMFIEQPLALPGSAKYFSVYLGTIVCCPTIPVMWLKWSDVYKWSLRTGARFPTGCHSGLKTDKSVVILSVLSTVLCEHCPSPVHVRVATSLSKGCTNTIDNTDIKH